MQDTLSRRITHHQTLTKQEQKKLLEILGRRCQAQTKKRLAFALRCVPDIANCGIYNRVHLDPPSYCAGQSYSVEIAVVRKCLIGR